MTVAGVAVLLASMSSAVVHADVNDFTVTYFGADYTLTADDPQGELQVVETIKVHFNDHNHGILRAIPSSYKKHRLQLRITEVSSRTGAPARYSTSNSNGNVVLQIGDPDRTVTGNQEYTIAYTVHNVIGFYLDHDELYWDINGNQWNQQFEAVTTTLHMADAVAPSKTQPLCYTGGFGSQESSCSLEYNRDGHSLRAVSLRPLNANETMSLVVAFDKGVFRPSSWQDTFGEYATSLWEALIPLVAIGGAASLYWLKRGRDAKGKGVIVPQYDAPPGLLPIEAGTVADFKTDNRDITATIIGLAIRGYIQIIENTKERKLLKDVVTYRLKLMRTDTTSLTKHETDILKALFANFQQHEEISLDYMKYKLASQAAVLRKNISTDLTHRGYFRVNPFVIQHYYAIGLYAVLGAVFALLGIFHSAGPVWFGVGGGFAIALIFLHFLPSRTAKGAAAKEHIHGLRLYLQTAEADRLRMLQSPQAPYIVRNQPQRTVELFEKFLPYAIVLRVEKDWAKQFDDIYKTPPDWYAGNGHAYNAVYLASSISDNMAASVNTAFSAPSSSSSSGFSGGFAGGGGGGGGGGGW